VVITEILELQSVTCHVGWHYTRHRQTCPVLTQFSTLQGWNSELILASVMQEYLAHFVLLFCSFAHDISVAQQCGLAVWISNVD